MFIVAGVVFVLVQGLVIVAVIKFRAKPDSPEPEQIHGNTRLEVGWTLAPALILLAVAFPTIITIFDLAKKPENPINVTVIGHQFWWEYRYDDLGVVTANELRMPAGRPVRLTLNSDDVIHSYWIAAPGREDRRRPRPEQPHALRGRRARRVPRPVHRVLRRLPRQHAGQGHRHGRRPTSTPGWPARRRAASTAGGRQPGRGGRPGLHPEGLWRLPHRRRASPRASSGPT